MRKRRQRLRDLIGCLRRELWKLMRAAESSEKTSSLLLFFFMAALDMQTHHVGIEACWLGST